MTTETLDREQIKRDAEGVLGNEPFYIDAGTLARHCLALLAALEQAERERGEARRKADRLKSELTIIREANERFGSTNTDLVEELQGSKSRLAKVPALVEALKEVRDMDPNVIAVVNGGLHGRIREALADYEGE